ncbi:MAG TPA: hypothetical protein DEP87_02930 [Candidatus Pacebacteria bacterium]|nr:hypothetical protein [Candidatus Paceibacterota bacterium]
MKLSLSQLFILAGIALAAMELILGVSAGFDLVLIGSILVISGLIGVFTANYLVALVLAIGLCGIYILIGRHYLQRKLNHFHKSMSVDRLITQVGIVTASIKPHHPGMVKIEDEQWRASSDLELAIDTKVTINHIEGVTLHVTKT